MGKLVSFFRRVPRLARIAAVLALVVPIMGLSYGLAHADPTYAVSGTVVMNGTPLSNVNVRLASLNGPEGSTTTNASGNYTISNLPSGTYYATLRYASHTTAVPNLTNMGTDASMPVVTISNASVTQNFSFTTKAVTMTVRTNDGSPVAGAAVTLRSIGNPNTVTTTEGVQFLVGAGTTGNNVSTDSSGTVTLNVLPGVLYSVCAVPSNPNNTGPRTYCATDTTVNADTSIQIDLPVFSTMAGSVTINGAAVPTTLSPLTVSLTSSAGGGSTNAAADGSYLINEVEPGNYFVTLRYNTRSTTVPGFTSISTPTPLVSLASAENATRSFTFGALSKVTTTLKDGSGTPISGAVVQIRNVGNADTIVTTDGTEFVASPGTTGNRGTTDANGTITLSVFPGVTYSVCATLTSGSTYCGSTITPTSDSTAAIFTVPIPSVPANLTANSPAQSSSLTWDTVSGANTYNVYRNATKIGSTATPGYTDTAAPDGTQIYSVTAVNAAGESNHSNSVTVLVDGMAPVITYTVTPIADSNGYNTGNVLVTFSCADLLSGIASCSDPVTFGDEGVGHATTGTATDNAGNVATVTATASLVARAINAGGGAAGTYVADTGFTGGSTYTSTATVDTSDVITPAPQDVYKSSRYGNLSYTLSSLTPDAEYTLSLNFNELYWGTSLANGGGVGSRVFNVSINGQNVLTNFDIFQAAGGANKAVNRQLLATADASGTISIQLTTVTDNALINGITLYNGTLPPQAPISVPMSPMLINAGGLAVEDFAADTNFTGGSTYTSAANVDTSYVGDDPAAEAVYQSVRYGNFTYHISSLVPNSQYHIRLHFNELYWGTSLAGGTGGTGSRVFNVAVDGNPALSNYDIYHTAGAANRAVVEDLWVYTGTVGKLDIQFTSVTDNAMVSGVEVIKPQQ